MERKKYIDRDEYKRAPGKKRSRKKRHKVVLRVYAAVTTSKPKD